MSPIKFRRESQPPHFKRWYFHKNRPIHFHINSTSVIRPVNETSWVFPGLKLISHCLPKSTMSCRSDSSSEANSSCCHRSEAWSYLEQKVVSSTSIEILQTISPGRSLKYSRKTLWPRREPWGTPALTGYSCEDFLRVMTFHSFTYLIILRA